MLAFLFLCRASSIQNASTSLCSHYEGHVCRDVFSTTLPSLSSLPRLHSERQNSRESTLQSAVTAINKHVTHPECNAALTTMLCHYTMPPCHANNSVTQFCINECHEMFSKCGHFIQQLEASLNVIPSDMEFSFPRCSELNNTSGMGEGSNETCVNLGFCKYV